MKKKLNWIVVGNMVGFIGGLLVILDTMYQLLFKPLFVNRMITLTPFGLIVLILAFIVCGANFNYFDERITKKYK